MSYAESVPGTIKDIIASLNSNFPLSQARVCCNGEIITDFSIKAKDGDFIAIKFVPYGDSPQEAGRSMKVGGWALIGLGIFALLIPGIGSLLGATLIGTGLSLTLGGTVLMNTQIPKLKDPEKPENDPSIRGAKNQARPHGRIPVLFGRHRLYPDHAANPHTSIIGNGQYFTQLFCGGYKDCVIDLSSFKLGETPLINFSQTKNINSILSCVDPIVKLEIIQNGEASKLYPHCVHEEAINAPLQNQIEDGDGNKISGEIERTTPDNTDTIKVDIFLYSGIGKYADKGGLESISVDGLESIGSLESLSVNGLKSTSVEVRAWYKKGDEPYSLLGYFNGDSNVISGAELKTKRCQITKSGLTPGQYTVKIERITPDSTDSKIIDQVHIGSIRSIKSVDKHGNDARPIRAERQKDLTIIALQVMATGKLNGVIDSFNYVAVSKIPVYSGAGTGQFYWLNAAETCNPASMLLYALQGRAAQESVNSDDIDWISLEDFYTWCEDHNYTCNAYLSESVTIAEIIKMIGTVARADILRIDSRISVVQDIERLSHMGLFTPKNSINYSVTMMQADIPDAITLRFINENSGYAQNELEIYNTPDGNRINEPEKIQKVDLWGITNSVQARRIGMYNYGCLKNRPFIHSIELDIEYLTCNKGDWIQYAGDIALTGSAQGRITALIFNEDLCIGIRIDEPVETDPNKQYAVRIRKYDGTILLKNVAAVQQPNMIYFSEPFNENDIPREGDIYAFGIRGYEVIDLIITDIQPQANFTAALTCVEYSPEIFKVDDPDFVLPDFDNKITPVSGAVESGVAGPAGWRLFITYHDGEEEPPRPDGGGQENGWHYAQTLRSVWQSSKTAESIDSGEWGAPVRIKNFRSDADVVPVYLSLHPQSKIFDCDSDGNMLTGLLPFTSQAALYKWNFKLPVVAGIERFPGTGGDLFDPMLGDFVPTENGIIYTLKNAPQGVSIDSDGRVFVSENVKLDGEHSIIVQAEYEGSIYSAVLFIQLKKRVGEAHYLGTIQTLPQNNPDIYIIKGAVQGQVKAVQGSYVLAVASGTLGAHTWTAGRVYQWTGFAWEYRDPEKYSNLYISCFKDGLDDPELSKDTSWFGAVFTRLLVAQQAFIENLQTMLIKLQNGGAIQSANFDSGSSGFRIEGDTGNAEFNKFTARGDSFFEGDIISGQIYSSNQETGVDLPQVTFSREETARDVHIRFGFGSNTYQTQDLMNVLISGSWGGRSASRLRLHTRRSGIGMTIYTEYLIDVTLSDISPPQTITKSWINVSGYRDTLGVSFVVDMGKKGNILRLIRLPAPGLDISGLMQGEVYKDPAGYLRIKN